MTESLIDYASDYPAPVVSDAPSDAASGGLQERQERRAKIHTVAKDLLVSHLDKKQLEQYQIGRMFEVIGSSGKRRYRLDNQGQVFRLDDSGLAIESFCIHPDYYSFPIPTPDLILAKKLMLELDEDKFLRTANMTKLVGRLGG